MDVETLSRHVMARNHLAFSRWGDGEWHAVLGRKGRNCDRHRYYENLGQALGNVLRGHEPKNYCLGMQSHARNTMGEDIDRWLKINTPPIEWVDADILHIAAWDGQLSPFVDALRSSGWVLVGPDILGVMRPDEHIRVPILDAWMDRERVLAECLDAMAANRDRVFVFCASMMSNWLIHVLWYASDHRSTLIDAGSVFDPWAGRLRRTYQRDRDIVAANPGVA